MRAHMVMRLALAEGALLRALGLIQRRGFTIGALSVNGESDHLRLNLSVETNGRNVEVLGRQLLRLHDVLALTLTDTEDETPPSPASP